jgi:hypothetical protein
LANHQLGTVQTAQGQRFRELRPIRVLAALDLGELARRHLQFTQTLSDPPNNPAAKGFCLCWGELEGRTNDAVQNGNCPNGVGRNWLS